MKRILAFSGIGVVLLAGSAGAAITAYWNMNEAGGNVADSSGNGLTGTASASGLTYSQASVGAGTYGNITISAPQAAAFGTSISFSRASTGNFDLGAPVAIDQLGEPGPTGTFTIMAWIRPNTVNSNTTYRVFSTGPSGGFGFGIANVDRIRFTTFSQVDFSTTGTPVAGNTWQHIAVSFDAGAVSMYANGILVGSTPASSGWSEETATNYRIGSSATSTEGFDGLIDELRIYNTVLSQSEIIAAATVPEPSVLGLLLGVGLTLVRRRR